MKVICERTINGVTKVVAVTTAPGNQGAHLIPIVGVGNPFWAWNAIPPGRVIGANFDGAPVCTDDPAQNNELIYGPMPDPNDVLFY